MSMEALRNKPEWHQNEQERTSSHGDKGMDGECILRASEGILKGINK